MYPEGPYECSFHSVSPHRIDSDGIEFAQVTGLFPGVEVTDTFGTCWRLFRSGLRSTAAWMRKTGSGNSIHNQNGTR